MRASVNIGSYTPDRQDVGSSGLERATNVVRVADGYVPMRDLISLNRGSLDDICVGAYSGRTQDGTNFIVGGTSAKLYVASTGDLTDESVGGGYSTGSDGRWEMELYGNKILATNYSDAPQSFEVGVSTTFAALSADASFAKHIGVIGEFVMLGNIIGRGVNLSEIGTLEGGVHWSAIGDETGWPDVTTDAAVAVQSDYQSFPDDGGEVTGIKSGTEWGLVFRERETIRAEYVGGDVYFAFEKVDEKRGCIIPGAAISVGNMTYFPSQEGWMACDGRQVIPIGHEKVDRTWREAVDLSQRFRVSTARSPELRTVFWNFPELGRIYAYNYELNDWSEIDKSVEWILPALPLSTGMDSAPYATADMDASPLPDLGSQNMDELDDASVAQLGAFDTSHELGTFTSDSRLLGVLETGNLGQSEMRTLVRWVRPLYTGDPDNTAIVVQIGSSVRPQADPTYGGIKVPSLTTGIAPIRSGGRYHKARFYLSGPIEGFNGFDVELAAQGDR